jgi:hypothetical protein
VVEGFPGQLCAQTPSRTSPAPSAVLAEVLIALDWIRRDLPRESSLDRGHEQAKRAIGTALATVKGVPTNMEPLVTGTQRRDDRRIIGSAASGLSSEDIDIGAVSLASQDSQTATLPLVITEDDSTAQGTAKLVEQGKNDADNSPSDPSFRPFVLSLGGMMKTDARDALKPWKSLMRGGGYSLLVKRLSVGLLRARARCLEP